MSGIFYVVRHASNDWLGRGIAGRQAGVHLNDLGRLEANRLAARLEREGLRRIFSSPLERSLETAQPVAAKAGLEVQVLEDLQEVDFGDWTGCSTTELDKL